MDLDGSLLNAGTLPASVLPGDWSLGPGASLHPAINNAHFGLEECGYLDPDASAAAALAAGGAGARALPRVVGAPSALCKGGLSFR